MPWIDKASLMIAIAALGLAIALICAAAAIVGHAVVHQLLIS